MFEIYQRSDYKKIVAWVMQNWDKLGLPKTNQNALKFNLLPFRKIGLHSLVNLLISSDKGPLIVIKIPRYKNGQLAFKAVEAEANNLRFLSEKGILTENLPQVYKFIEIDKTPVVIMKAYEGEMLHQLLDKEDSPSKIENLLLSGARPLVTLHAVQEKTTAQLEFSHITNQLEVVVQYYPDLIKKIETSLTNFLQERCFDTLNYPRVFSHCEYNPWNLLQEQNGNIIILDWEDAQRESFPLLDLFNYFTVALRILLAGESPSAKNRQLEQKQERAAILLRCYKQFEKQYCAKLNLDLKKIDFFFIVFCLNSAMFFIDEKRKEINYGKTWLTPLTNLAPYNCFENYLKQLVKSYAG